VPRVLDLLTGLFLTTLLQGLPAIVALVAWSEGGHRVMRQFGARMLWELAAAVAVGIGVLLYLTLRVVADETANLAVIAVASLCAVPIVTGVTHRFRPDSAPLRFAVTAGVAIVALLVGVVVGVGVYVMVWQPAK
jgi:hypothetical protein